MAMPLVNNLQQQAAECLRQRKYSEAALLYEQLIQAEPTTMSSYWYAGLALLLQGQETEAQMTWLSALSQGEPEQVEAWTADLVEILLTAAAQQEAQGEFQAAWLIRQYGREFAPTHFNNLLAIVLLAAQLNDLATYAEPALTEATQILSTQQPLEVEPEQVLSVMNALAEINPNHPFFSALFEAGDRLNDPDRQIFNRLSQIYAQAGAHLLQQGRDDEANHKFRDALSLGEKLTEGNFAVAHFNLGICLFKQGEFAEARDHFQVVKEMDPTFPNIQLQLSRVNYHLQNAPKGYQFSGDWFGRNVFLWEEHLMHLAHRPNLNVLEIGSWEGRSACWFLENLLTQPSSTITCIDTFAGGGGADFSGSDNRDIIEARFDHNISRTGSPATVIKKVGTSREMLRSLPLNSYDLIYIDGSHFAADALEDAALSWGLARVGAIIVFDDYDFHFENAPEDDTYIGIDAFMSAFSSKLRLIHQSHQVIVEKIAD
ncbi:class I SAM-dependent methyltransferase [Leptothermofonsia sp. ETS-13]|uniref:class I SAM-dependent methyltransferase n=1 Tax=Leptothermofonsia sp. ETS-13 TaxID=3035696 RepID=UPI003BA1C001